ncbi:hypothetical protein VTI74DRAFT_9023 [Chaetomium olivicolor]
MSLLWQLVLLGTLVGLGLAQDCPILGSAYPEVTNPGASGAFKAAKTPFDDELTKALAEGTLDNSTTFAIQVYSRHSDKLLYERYHGLSIGPQTLYRIASISKLISIYTTMAALGEGHWDDPVTRHIPELARLKVQNPVYDINWDEVTLGSLTSHMSGIARDFAIGDLSPYIPPGIPGLPALNESEQIQCGLGDRGMRPCTREESFAKIKNMRPISPTYHTPSYSNVAFQLLGYSVEKIARTPFPSLVQNKVLKPLKMNRTFLKPVNDSNALVFDGFDLDMGDAAPGGGYYSTPSDITTLGRSILSSTLLPPATTRRWLKPITHTARASLSIGRPWEINRLNLPVSTAPASTVTHVVDVYTKQGSAGQYMTLIALSPDHGVGFTLFVGGPAAGKTYDLLQRRLSEVWFAAAEQAGREEGGAVYGGNYTLPDGSVAEFVLRDNEPGLFLSRLVSNGTDVLALMGTLNGVPEGMRMGAWLYPMGLQGKGKVAFRASMGVQGLPAGEACAAWGSIDLVRYGGYSADLFVFELGKDGGAVAVEIPVLKKTLRKENGGRKS